MDYKCPFAKDKCTKLYDKGVTIQPGKFCYDFCNPNDINQIDARIIKIINSVKVVKNKMEQPQRPVNFAELKVPASVASTRLNICGQTCGGLRDKTKCPIGITPCQIKSGKVLECPLGKWPK
jgi:hypothetical protein